MSRTGAPLLHRTPRSGRGAEPAKRLTTPAKTLAGRSPETGTGTAAPAKDFPVRAPPGRWPMREPRTSRTGLQPVGFRSCRTESDGLEACPTVRGSRYYAAVAAALRAIRRHGVAPMPDAHYANSRRRRPARHNRCAMIFLCLGDSGMSCVKIGEAGRGNLIMASKPSTRFFRAILFFLASFGISGVAQAAALDDSAMKLADEIGAKMPPGAQASCEFANLSSLPAEDAARIEQSFREALRSWCIPASAENVPSIELSVTLSENWKDLVWTAQIRTGGATIVLLETSPRTSKSLGAPGAMPLALRAEKIWEGPRRILDFATLQPPSPAAPPEFWLLTDDGVVLRQVGGKIISQLQLPRTIPLGRDPVGDLTKNGQDVRASFSGKVCTISSESFSVTECHPGSSTLGNSGDAGAPSAAGSIVRQRGNQSAFVEGACPFVRPALGSGRGDYTERDFVQLFDPDGSRADAAGIPVSAPIFFAGPVVDISGAEDLGIVVHNLESENYEAYRIFISCSR